MPTYEYLCEKCDLGFEVVKSIHEYKTPEKCTACGNLAVKQFTCKVHFVGTKVEDAEYNVGLGKITKSKAHRKELANRLGVVELGNDVSSPDKVHKHFDSHREEKRKKSWDEF